MSLLPGGAKFLEGRGRWRSRGYQHSVNRLSGYPTEETMSSDYRDLIAIGSGLRRLVPAKLEDLLRGVMPYSEQQRQWSRRVVDRGLLVNLSRLEWADMGAAVQLVSLVEGAAEAGVRVVVALPLERPRESEVGWYLAGSIERGDQFLGQIVVRRARVRRFLDTLGFRRALALSHLSANVTRPTVISDWDDSSADSPEDLENLSGLVGAEREVLYKYCFPLTWLKSNDNLNLEQIAGFFRRVISVEERGLEGFDVDVVTNVLLSELADNVAVHSRSDSRRAALVAAWARPSSTPPMPSDYLLTEQDYARWILDSGTPLVEIVVADSGQGVIATLSSAFESKTSDEPPASEFGGDQKDRLLLWAFDKWSSSLRGHGRRGTRGLYRVQRVVQKYQGLLSLRTGNRLLVLDHGGSGYNRAKPSPRYLAPIPGTVLCVRMPPGKPHAIKRLESHEDSPVADLHFLSLGEIEEGGLSEEDECSLIKALSRRGAVGRPHVVVAVFSGGVPRHESVANVLRQAVELRHPAALVVMGLPGGVDLLEGAVESVNADLRQGSKEREESWADHYDIWDPVLVVGSREETLWVGVTGGLEIALHALVAREGRRISREDLFRRLSSVDHLETAKGLRKDPCLVEESANGDELALTFSLAGVFEEIERRLRVSVQDSSCTEPGPLADPFPRSGLVLASSREGNREGGWRCGGCPRIGKKDKRIPSREGRGSA